MKACLLLAGTPEGTLIWNGQPPIDFAGDLARIQAGYTAVRALAIEADTDNSRTTDDKAEAEDILEALTLQMAAARRNHFKKTSNKADRAKVAFPKRGLVRRRDQALTLSRRNRDIQNALVYEIMKNYRQAVPSLCRAFPAIVDSLPRLTPEPGSTPDALTATGIFQAPDIAHIEHSPVTQGGIKRVKLRGNLGETYNLDLATRLAQHGPNDPAVFNTSHGLTGPGTKLVVKVFVINETDNEAGSNSVVIIRPA